MSSNIVLQYSVMNFKDKNKLDVLVVKDDNDNVNQNRTISCRTERTLKNL